MPFRAQRLPVTALLCAVLLTGSLINVAAVGAAEAVPVDPPVFVTNLSGNPVELQWQTVLPNAALSPLRGSAIGADATDSPAEQGLFWFYDPADGNAVENVVFVSIVDADGAILSQVVMEEEIAGTLSTVEDAALHITIEADGTLTLSVDEAD